MDRKTRHELLGLAFIMNDSTNKRVFEVFQDILLNCGYCWIGRENLFGYREELERLQHDNNYIIIFPNPSTIQPLNIKDLDRVKRSRQLVDFNVFNNILSSDNMHHHNTYNFMGAIKNYYNGLKVSRRNGIGRIEIDPIQDEIMEIIMEREQKLRKEFIGKIQDTKQEKYGENIIKMHEIDIKFKNGYANKEVIKFNTLESMLLIPNK